MHANLILLFKLALYSSTLVIKLFGSSIKVFYAEILTVAHRPVFYKLRNPHSTPTFKTEELRLVRMYNRLNGFYHVMSSNTALPCSSLTVTHYALCN